MNIIIIINIGPPLIIIYLNDICNASESYMQMIYL